MSEPKKEEPSFRAGDVVAIYRNNHHKGNIRAGKPYVVRSFHRGWGQDFFTLKLDNGTIGVIAADSFELYRQTIPKNISTKYSSPRPPRGQRGSRTTNKKIFIEEYNEIISQQDALEKAIKPE